MIYILEARAIVEIFSRCGSPPDTAKRLNALVTSGELTFPEQVIDELKASHDAEPCLLWAIGIKPSLPACAVPWDRLQDVLDDYPDLNDAGSKRDLSGPAVIAQSRELADGGAAIAIVLEDVGEKPSRMSLEEACNQENCQYLRAEELIDEEGLWPDG